MKKGLLIILICLILVGCYNAKEEENNEVKDDSTAKEETTSSEPEKLEYPVTLYLFYNASCDHCHEELEWLDSIKDNYSNLTIVTYEASENLDLYYKVKEGMSIDSMYVPLTIIGNNYYIGFASYDKVAFLGAIKSYASFDNCDVVKTIQTNGDVTACLNKNKKYS